MTQCRQDKIAHMQRLVEEGLSSGVSSRTMDDILVEARKKAGGPVEDRGL